MVLTVLDEIEATNEVAQACQANESFSDETLAPSKKKGKFSAIGFLHKVNLALVYQKRLNVR